jgi:cobalt/nickel transport system permease protein
VHIPDGYLGPQTFLSGYVVMAPVWIAAGRRLKGLLTGAQAPLLGLAAAFCFVVMMLNIPIPGGTTGHATGAALIAILLGPAAAIVSVSVALAVQALVFGDGGIAAFGANCFNMALVMPLAAYGTFRLLAGKAQEGSGRRLFAAVIAGYVSLNAAALTTAIMFGIQPAIAHDAAGRPLYSPYPLSVALAAMMIPHLLVFGIAEGAVTGLALRFLEGATLGWKPSFQPARQTGSEKPHLLSRRWGQVVILLVLISPLGVFLPAWLGGETAWGEWSALEIGRLVGFLPEGMGAWAEKWNAPLPDYALSWQGESAGWLALVYVASALIGTGLVIAISWGMGRLFRRPQKMT